VHVYVYIIYAHKHTPAHISNYRRSVDRSIDQSVTHSITHATNQAIEKTNQTRQQTNKQTNKHTHKIDNTQNPPGGKALESGLGTQVLRKVPSIKATIPAPGGEPRAQIASNQLLSCCRNRIGLNRNRSPHVSSSS